MKRCPHCGREYDASMMFCLDDGAELLYGPASADEPATAILYETASPTDAATRTQLHTTGQTEILLSDASYTGKPKGFDKRLIIFPLVLAVIVLGGFFGYRYVTPAKQIDSIAVMPFVNESGNADVDYLSDGITESLMNNLSQLADLSVKGRSSVFRFKGRDVEPQQLASELNVQAVLNGRVTQRGDTLVVSLDLVDGRTGNQIWGEQYSRKSGDLAVLQSEIARDVSQKLRAKLSGAEENRVVKNQTQNTEAYQLYLQGRYHWNKRTQEGTKKAIEYFQQAIDKDPNYAMAYVGLAESYLLSEFTLGLERYGKARAAAEKALEIDPSLGEPHAALGAVMDTYEQNFAGAEQEYHRAIQLSPNYATAYHWYAELLSQQGRFDESLPVWKKALELDPLSLAIGTDYALEYLFYSRKYDEAVEYLKNLIQIDSSYVRTHTYLANVYFQLGRYEDGINELEKRALLQGMSADEVTRTKKELVEAFRSRGQKGYWSKILDLTLAEQKKGEKIPPSVFASIYAQIGEPDEAFRWLERAYQEKDIELIWITVDPKWDALRGDARFADLLRRSGPQGLPSTKVE